MIWTDLKGVEQKIVEKQYSDKEALNYFLGIVILYSLGSFLFLEYFEKIYKLTVTPAFIITIVGTLKSFEVYTKNRGSDFFKDFFALSWVLHWRMFFFGIEIFIGSILVSSMQQPKRHIKLIPPT